MRDKIQLGAVVRWQLTNSAMSVEFIFCSLYTRMTVFSALESTFVSGIDDADFGQKLYWKMFFSTLFLFDAMPFLFSWMVLFMFCV